MTERVRWHGMAYGGSAVGRLNDGAAVFVAGGLPGELAEIEVLERRKNFARGRLVNVLEPAAERIAPPCRHFLEGCGGCQWQHAGYEAQLRYKQDILADQLRRIGGIADASLKEPIASPLPFGYRNVAELHVALPGNAGGRPAGPAARRLALVGFNREASHEIVDVEQCPLMEAPINAALTVLRKHRDGLDGIRMAHVRQGLDAVQVTLQTEGDARAYKLLAQELAEQVGGECRVAGLRAGTDRLRGLAGPPFVWMGLAGHRFRVSGSSFFQVNSSVAELLAEAVIAEVRPNERLLDLFSGVGTFTLLAAERAREVVGVEESRAAVADASTNAAEFAAENVRFEQSDVAASAGLAAEAWDLAILDPPRAGCPRPVLDALDAERIVYVSCDPSTLARDLKVLIGRGYQLKSAQLFDMFPQTYHIETLATLSR